MISLNKTLSLPNRGLFRSIFQNLTALLLVGLSQTICAQGRQ
jgi:hypothetical protein